MAKAPDRLRIIVLGYMVRGPVGGMAWSDLHYTLGLRTLGHDVYFLEDSGDTEWCCYDPVRNVTDTDPGYGLQFAAREFESKGLGDRWAYYDAHRSHWLGPCANRVAEICKTADLLLDVLNLGPLRSWFLRIPSRALIDKDPVFTQIRHLSEPGARSFAEQHTHFFSFGENFGLSDCTIPNDGFPWKPTRHPVFLDGWPKTPAPKHGTFTTVMLWDSYRKAEYGGRRYGMKSDSFGPYADLPGRAGNMFELAVGGPTVPRRQLREQGWRVRDPLKVALSTADYQKYIQKSKAEFTVAKHAYVATRSGWFSERSASYLASGRPVLVEDTAFATHVPAGEGVLSFSSPDGALAGIEEIERRYDFHCTAAREIAEACFDSRKVLLQVIEEAGKAQRPLEPMCLPAGAQQ